jgi:hypothetical protein
MIPKDHLSLTVEYLKSILTYDPETGDLTRKPRLRKSGKYSPAKIAGCLSGEYRTIGINGKVYKCHRIGWVIHTGKWPAELIDHIDGDKYNNKISNLREATVAQNTCNSRLSKRGTSGVKGVSVCSGPKGFKATIRRGKEYFHLGYHSTLDAAAKAYADAAPIIHGEFAWIDSPKKICPQEISSLKP